MTNPQVKSPISEEQFRSLNQLFIRSPREAEAMFSDLCGETGRAVTAITGSSARMVYLVDRPGTGQDFGVDRETENAAIAELLCFAGAGPQLRKLRKLGERQAPSPQRVPSEAWVARAEGPSPYGPDVQALSALRVLQRVRRLERDMPWAVSLAGERLVELVAEFPVLLYPGLLFDYQVRDSMAQIEPAPLLHAILRSPAAGLPHSDHVGPSRMRDFAVHPCVAAATRSAAPVAHLPNNGRKFATWGRSPATLLLSIETPRANVVGPLLQIDRLRRESGKTGLFGVASLQNAVAARLSAAVRSFVARGTSGHAAQLLLSEMTLSPSVKVTERHMLEAMSGVLADVSPRGAGIMPGAAPDPADRFERAAQLVQQLGLRSTPNDAARAVLVGILPLPGEDVSFGGHLHRASLQTAHEFMARWQDAGVSLEELRTRVSQWQGHDSVWMRALQTFETERAMTRAIDEHATPACTPTRHRSRANL